LAPARFRSGGRTSGWPGAILRTSISGRRDTQSLFEEIVQARVLSDPTTRSVYDRQGGQASARQESSPAAFPRGGGGRRRHVAIELSFAQSARVVWRRMFPSSALVSLRGLRGDGRAAPERRRRPCQHCEAPARCGATRGPVTARPVPPVAGRTSAVSEACPEAAARGLCKRANVPVVISRRTWTPAPRCVCPARGNAGPSGSRGDLVVIVRVHEDAALRARATTSIRSPW